ncbi:hypothetical protein TNCV_4639211 [Trichonephila clavipes]|nr:hypothetical protein TNCV_4639211 [Trichonephila clavipes]
MGQLGPGLGIENHQTQSQYNDALVIKLFAFQFANTYASLFYTAFFRRCASYAGFYGVDLIEHLGQWPPTPEPRNKS